MQFNIQADGPLYTGGEWLLIVFSTGADTSKKSYAGKLLERMKTGVSKLTSIEAFLCKLSSL